MEGAAKYAGIVLSMYALGAIAQDRPVSTPYDSKVRQLTEFVLRHEQQGPVELRSLSKSENRRSSRKASLIDAHVLNQDYTLLAIEECKLLGGSRLCSSTLWVKMYAKGRKGDAFRWSSHEQNPYITEILYREAGSPVEVKVPKGFGSFPGKKGQGMGADGLMYTKEDGEKDKELFSAANTVSNSVLDSLVEKLLPKRRQVKR